MFQQAIDKLQTEMDNNKTNSYIQVVGKFLLEKLTASPGLAEHFLANNKTIGGSLAEMRKEAEKHNTGSCAVLTDDEGFSVVLKYYGIESDWVNDTPPAPVPKPKAVFDVSLDELLQG